MWACPAGGKRTNLARDLPGLPVTVDARCRALPSKERKALAWRRGLPVRSMMYGLIYIKRWQRQMPVTVYLAAWKPDTTARRAVLARRAAPHYQVRLLAPWKPKYAAPDSTRFRVTLKKARRGR